jgi:protein-S-isoprenylcysteine O-methyltransferase Ste14
MADETPFRVALAVNIVLTISVTAYYRIQAAAAGGRVSHQEEGYFFAALLRVAGLAMGVATFVYLFFPASFAWALMPLPAWLRWLGCAVGLSGPLLMYWTLSNLGTNLTDTVVTRKGAFMVTRGPYRWVRHPFYVTTALILAAVTVLTANWLIGVAGLLVLLLLAIRTPKEERMLMERFGDQYRDYMAHTGKFWPRLRRR